MRNPKQHFTSVPSRQRRLSCNLPIKRKETTPITTRDSQELQKEYKKKGTTKIERYRSSASKDFLARVFIFSLSEYILKSLTETVWGKHKNAQEIKELNENGKKKRKFERKECDLQFLKVPRSSASVSLPFVFP